MAEGRVLVWLRRADEETTDIVEEAIATVERFPWLFGPVPQPDGGVDPEYDLLVDSWGGDPSLAPWDLELFDPEHDVALLHGGVDRAGPVVSIPLDAIAFLAWDLEAPAVEGEGRSEQIAGT